MTIYGHRLDERTLNCKDCLIDVDILLAIQAIVPTPPPKKGMEDE